MIELKECRTRLWPGLLNTREEFDCLLIRDGDTDRVRDVAVDHPVGLDAIDTGEHQEVFPTDAAALATDLVPLWLDLGRACNEIFGARDVVRAEQLRGLVDGLGFENAVGGRGAVPALDRPANESGPPI